MDAARTAIGFTFPTTDWLDPFDLDEPRTQWFFVNHDRISRAWTAPSGDQDQGWGFAEGERMYDFFNDPRSCLYCLEKSAIVGDGRVLREWTPTPLKQKRSPESCAQHNGLYFLYAQTQNVLPVHEGVKYSTYEEALAEALKDRAATHRTLIARMVHAESLW